MEFNNTIEQVLLTNDGFKLIEKNFETNEVKILEDVDNIFDYLIYSVKTDVDVKFSDLLDAIFSQKEQVQEFFSSYLDGVTIDELYLDFVDILEPEELEKYDDDLDGIDEIYFNIFTTFHDNSMVNVNFLTELMTLIGVPKIETNDIDDGHLLSFEYIDVAQIPLSILGTYPLHINNTYSIQGVRYTDTIGEYEDYTVLDTTKTITLFDLISNTLLTITTYGSPNERYENYNRMRNEIKNEINRKISIDNLLKSINSDDNEDSEE